MKVKDIDRTANIAWSPSQQFPVYIAAGTAAQQLDATFSTNAALELYLFDPESKSLTCKNVCSAQVEHRFNKVVWGCQGMGHGGSEAAGIIVGAMDNGLIYVWDAARLLQQNDGSRLHTLSKPQQPGGGSGNGIVTSLDFNPFKPNLLASGGSESEILIWDLEKPTSPMAPGAKSQPLDEVTCLAWNRQVQHILASTLSSRCIVWDLRKNEPIIKISDSMSRIKSKTVVWHPEVATQMCLSSEDDHTPVIQLWDLRYAASPVKVLEKHERGILSMAWCHQDPDLLLSCSKDNRVLCWNPNSSVQGGEVVYELPSNQWCFDVQWCPRNPQVISASSFEGHIGIYTLMGGEIVTTDVSQQSHSKIADSFGAIDDPPHVPKHKQQERHIVPPLAKAPKWLKRPCGVSFGFGGKLVTFNDDKTAESGGDGEQGRRRRCVLLSSVVTEEELLGRSAQLERAVGAGQHREYCALKAANSDHESLDQQLWNFLKANFDADASKSFLHLLGFDDSKLENQVKALSLHSPLPTSTAQASGLTAEEDDSEDQQPSSSAIETSGSSRLASASHTSTSSASIGGDSSIFDSIGQPPARSASPTVSAALLIQCDTGSSVGLLTRALLTGNLQLAVDICLRDERMADALILAASQGPELFERTMRQYFSRRHDVTSKLISSVVNRKYADIVHTCSLDSWKEALALVLTYARPDELRPLCDVLGARLENEHDGKFAPEAILCYICSGNVSKFVEAWQAAHADSCAEPMALQDLVEKVTLLRHAVSYRHGQSGAGGSSVALERKLAEYGELLASQGSLQVALDYLSTGPADSNKQQNQVTDLGVLCHRVARALGQQSSSPWRIQPLPTHATAGQGRAAAAAAAAQPSSARPGLAAAGASQPASTAAAYLQQQQQHQQPGHGPLHSTLSGGQHQQHSLGGSRASASQAAGHGAAEARQAPALAAGVPAAAAAAQPSAGYYGGTMPGAGAAGLYGAGQNFTAATPPGGYAAGGSSAAYEQPQSAPLNAAALSSSGGVGAYAQPGGAYSHWPGQQQQPSVGQSQAGHVVTRGLLAQKYASPHQQATAAQAPALAQPQLPSNVFNPAAVQPASSASSALGHHQSTAFVAAAAPGASDGYGSATLAAPTMLFQQHSAGYASAAAGSVGTQATQDELRYEGSKVPAGWNDPPAMSGAAAGQSAKKQLPQDQQAPILMPIYNPGGVGGGMGDQSQASGLQPASGHYYNPNDYQQQQHAPPPSPKEAAAHEGPASHARQPKGPIPSEHQVLCDVFNSIAFKCLDSADSAQTKRKLEMVLTELEVLYDKLREYQLSQSVLGGLHQIAQAITVSDYAVSLSVVAAVIAQGNFSEIGAFMPGIKMLLQTAQRLRVYL